MQYKVEDIDPPEGEVEYSVHLQESDVPIDGNASAVNEEYDKEVATEIRRRLQSGDVRAWCDVTVTATWNGEVGRASLCACNLSPDAGSEDELVDDYELKAEAMDRLRSEICARLNRAEALKESLSLVETKGERGS